MTRMALRAIEPGPTFAEAVTTALDELGWKVGSLYARYEIAGGALSLSALKNYVDGTSRPQIDDYHLIAVVLNEALGEERFPPLPFHFPPRLRGRDSNPQPSVFKPERVAA